ncbi:KilA-N domain-containing protein [Vibrio ouci]|uniref:KilA-N domain-containing protein n=1 Tax=Vibrio ouci TaxID=2499078 RepID=A0A4Y8W8M3_9VIBR|nr:KilA-N domain-containing protein [Vibrio ouci]TFH89144.1 KilA-N domain-containing protein [Vibrio ouci]
MATLTILSKDIRTLDDLFSLNDLHKVSGSAPKHQPALFMQNQQTKALIYEIEGDLGIPRSVIAQRGGANRGTWVCKELVYSYAMWISPKFHLQVIRAFDAMMTPPLQGVTLSEKQARFVQCTFNQMDKLQARYQLTRQQHRAMMEQVATMRTFCDKMEQNLKHFQSQLDGDFDVVNHIHLYKGMALDYQGVRELKDFMERDF